MLTQMSINIFTMYFQTYLTRKSFICWVNLSYTFELYGALH